MAPPEGVAVAAASQEAGQLTEGPEEETATLMREVMDAIAELVHPLASVTDAV